LLDSQDEGNKIPRRAGKYLPVGTAKHLRRQEPSTLALSEYHLVRISKI